MVRERSWCPVGITDVTDDADQQIFFEFHPTSLQEADEGRVGNMADLSIQGGISSALSDFYPQAADGVQYAARG